MARFKILYLASELYPFAKVGGLADVAGTLPKVLKDKEHDIRVFIPKYKIIRDRKYNLREVIRLKDIQVPLGSETYSVSVKSGFVPDSKVQAYFLEYKPFFDRNDIYVDPKTGQGWQDDALRFALFAKAALETLKVLFWAPDVIHVNDWPSAMLPHYLKTAHGEDEFFAKTKTLLTIHNLAYQGDFPPEVAGGILDEAETFDDNHPGWHNGRLNFLKAGIQQSDFITTVSPTYAHEIISDESLGAGLGEVLATRSDSLQGVLNGIDHEDWDPETDRELPKNYSREELDGKAECRGALCEEMGLECGEDDLVIGMISRLVEQKGFDLLLEAADDLLQLPVRLVVLGTGDKEMEERLRALAEANPGRIGVRIGFEPGLARRIEAGSDTFLMPSRYEPCGLNQMYSLRYGTPPIVRATGGLKDTVREYDPDSGEGNGFLFEEASSSALVEAVKRAATLHENKEAWRKLMLNGMAEDNSWIAAAERMEELYKTLTGGE